MGPPISLRKILEVTLPGHVARRYLKNIPSDLHSPRFYYNAALRELSLKDSEGAIHYLILSLDIDPEYSPSLHLTRTMLFGLSKLFYEEHGDLYKQKYPDIGKWQTELDKKIKDIELKITRIQQQILQSQSKNILNRLFNPWFKKKSKKLQSELERLTKEKIDLKQKRQYATKMGQIEEFSRILSLILEVSLYPARFSWINKPKEELITEERKVWYG